MRPLRPVFPLALALLLTAASAGAHEYWLAPSSFAPAPGEEVAVSALSGMGFRGERRPFSPARCVRLEARGGAIVDLAPQGVDGDTAWAGFRPADGGGAMLAYQSAYIPIELAAAEFEAYLIEEGLDAALDARRARADTTIGRERYRRCAKTWLAGTEARRATRPAGLPLEIVPLGIPGAAAELRVRVLWAGQPLAGGLIKAWRVPFGAGGHAADPAGRDTVAIAWQGRTDRRGEARIPAAADGQWLLSLVHMVPCPERAVADWESNWASLTFERRATRP